MMCLRLARYWQSGFDQHVIACSPSKLALESEFRSLHHCTTDIGSAGSQSKFQQWVWVRGIMSRVQPDAVLIHCFGIPHLIAAAAARAVGIRSIAAWAGNPPPRSAKMRQRFKNMATISHQLRCPVVACSSSVAQAFNTLGIRLPAIIPNGIDVRDVAERVRQARNSRMNTNAVIGMVSRLDTIKDHRTLLNAFALIRREMPEAQLWIVGDGPLRPMLETLAQGLGIASSTRFFGNRTDVPYLLGGMDIFAFSTTRDEGFGIALIEAMAAEVPVVASAVPACSEVLADGEAGILAEAEDADALAQNIIHLVKNRATQQRLIHIAQRRVISEYSVESCAERWERLLFGSSASESLFTPCAS